MLDDKLQLYTDTQNMSNRHDANNHANSGA